MSRQPIADRRLSLNPISSLVSPGGDLDGSPFEGGEPIRLERRGCERWSAEGGAIAVFRYEDGRAGITPVDLVDLSFGGAAVMTDVAIEAGTVVAFCGGDASLAGRSAVVTQATGQLGGTGAAVSFESFGMRLGWGGVGGVGLPGLLKL